MSPRALLSILLALAAAVTPATGAAQPQSQISAGITRLERRYPTHDSYVNAVTQAATDLEQQRLLLEPDVQAYIQAAAQSTVGR